MYRSICDRYILRLSNRLPIRNFEPYKWGLVDDRLRSNHKRKAVIRKAKTALENPKHQAPAYKKMGYPLTALENPDRVLKGFNGSTTISARDVVLPVEAVPVILNTKFSVVASLSPYNTIYGRSWIDKMKVIPFNHPPITEQGQVDIHGSQLAARQCYQISIPREDAPTGKEPSELEVKPNKI